MKKLKIPAKTVAKIKLALAKQTRTHPYLKHLQRQREDSDALTSKVLESAKPYTEELMDLIVKVQALSYALTSVNEKVSAMVGTENAMDDDLVQSKLNALSLIALTKYLGSALQLTEEEIHSALPALASRLDGRKSKT